MLKIGSSSKQYAPKLQLADEEKIYKKLAVISVK